MRTKFYHTTTESAAVAILRDGFRDAEGGFLTGLQWKGVWMSDAPLDPNEGVKGITVLVIQTDLSLGAFASYEWVEEGKPYREWLIPASLLNSSCKVSMLETQE
jgi:hypothetical protein